MSRFNISNASKIQSLIVLNPTFNTQLKIANDDFHYILNHQTNLPHSKESPCMKRTTGMGAVLISPEAGTYTFRYRQSSDWLLGRNFFLQCNDHDDGDGDGEDVDGDDDNDVGDDDDDDVGDDDGDDVQVQVVLGLVDWKQIFSRALTREGLTIEGRER